MQTRTNATLGNILLGSLIFGSLLTQPALAQTATTTKPADTKNAGDKSDKLDLKQLDDKYWSAKDTDFTVIQNRTYSKDSRWFLSGSYGTLVNDAYSTGRLMNLAAGYYFTERWGIELAHEQGWLSDNGSTTALSTYNGLKPNYNKFQDYTSVNVLWVPMYAKMSVLDHAIWYFDLQFAAGIGRTDYQSQITPGDGPNFNQSALGYNIDVTAQIFFSTHWAFRMDLKNKFTSEDLQRYNNAGYTTSRDLGTQSNQDTTFLLGFTYFFGSPK